MNNQTNLNLIVVKTSRLTDSLSFYRALGLSFVEEQHGTGPKHFSANLGGVVLELYPGTDGNAPDRKSGGATMMGFKVASLDGVLAELSKLAIQVISPAKESAWGRRAVVADPDGRAIELSE